MLPSQVRNDLASYLGVEDPTHIPDNALARITSDLNACLQDIWAKGPAWLREGSIGAILNGPTPTTLGALTQGSNAWTGADTLPAWAFRNTVRIAGEPHDNQILSKARKEFVVPIMGANRAGVGTVYGDSFKLPAYAQSVLRVIIPDKYQLNPVPEASALMRHGRYGYRLDYGSEFEYKTITTKLDVREPTHFRIEAHRPISPTGYQTTFEYHIRVVPLPPGPTPIQIDLEFGPPRYETISSLPGAEDEIPLPNNYAESILLPMVRARFSTWPHFNQPDLIQVLMGDAQAAMRQLEHLRPQRNSGARLRPSYFA